MKVYSYKLEFEGPTHFGDTGIDLENVSEWVNSDTLFSAIVNAAAAIEGNEGAKNLIAKFNENPPFLISSLFIYSSERYFMPCPLADDNISADLKRKMGKELRRLKWLDVEGFHKWSHGNTLTEKDIEAMLSTQDEYKKSFTVDIRPRVAIDRTFYNSAIYHCGYVRFRENAGLYGLVAFNDMSSSIEKFTNLITIVGQTGLGGERTYGCGLFKFCGLSDVSGILQKVIDTNTGRFTLLSLYHPSPDERSEICNSLISYDLLRKRGWITSGRHALALKRQSVGFFTEGSVLTVQPKGCLVCVTPDRDDIADGMLNHDVYRYGYAFTAPSLSSF